MHKVKVVFTGGGTGGHVMPLIAVSRALRQLQPEARLFYIGPKKDAQEFKKEGFIVHPVAAGKLRRYFSFWNIVDTMILMPLGFLQSFWWLTWINPRLVFSKGGTGALPVCYAARILSIPVFIHESDTVPGLSNKTSGKWAKKIFTSFENVENLDSAKVTVVGTPVRKEVSQGKKDSAKATFKLTFEKPIILVWGGSQGAGPLNTFLSNILEDILPSYEVIHVCGQNNYQEVYKETETLDNNLQKYYHLYATLDERGVADALAAADLIVSRAGSASIFEIAAVGKPSILIPLPSSAGNHQVKNAYQYADTGAAVVIEQANLTTHFFMAEISKIVSNPHKIEQMRAAALAFAKPNAAEKIAQEILNYTTKKQ